MSRFKFVPFLPHLHLLASYMFLFIYLSWCLVNGITVPQPPPLQMYFYCPKLSILILLPSNLHLQLLVLPSSINFGSRPSYCALDKHMSTARPFLNLSPMINSLLSFASLLYLYLLFLCPSRIRKPY